LVAIVVNLPLVREVGCCGARSIAPAVVVVAPAVIVIAVETNGTDASTRGAHCGVRARFESSKTKPLKYTHIDLYDASI